MGRNFGIELRFVELQSKGACSGPWVGPATAVNSNDGKDDDEAVFASRAPYLKSNTQEPLVCRALYRDSNGNHFPGTEW